jgi:hypothetical protein
MEGRMDRASHLLLAASLDIVARGLRMLAKERGWDAVEVLIQADGRVEMRADNKTEK